MEEELGSSFVVVKLVMLPMWDAGVGKIYGVYYIYIYICGGMEFLIALSSLDCSSTFTRKSIMAYHHIMRKKAKVGLLFITRVKITGKWGENLDILVLYSQI